MLDPRAYLIPIVDFDDPRCRELVRKVVFQPPNRSREDEFFPAVAEVRIGDGNQVDVSYLYSFSRSPSDGCERHVNTEEMFVPIEGGLCMPVAAYVGAENRHEKPSGSDFVGVLVRRGEAIILSRNTWHYGGWPLDADEGVRYLMVLSGHRKGNSGEGRLDHMVTKLRNGELIYPDW